MFTTKQEEFWAGDFGNKYIDRNIDGNGIARRVYLFGKILSRTQDVQSVIELGANIGQNLIAIRTLLPNVSLSAVEINQKAVKKLEQLGEISEIFSSSILEFRPQKTYDFVLTRGVLIHIDPNSLNDVYRILYDCSKRYLCLIEYYNPTPVEVEYRGHKGVLFKRDFAGEVMNIFSNIELIDYGFVYRRDPNFPQDDLTWFLLKKC